MILVAGLAIAGLAGIAAAFYFSVRPGNSSNQLSSRVRAAGPGRTGADRSPARSSRSAISPDRSGQTARRSRPDTGADFSGPPRRREDSGHLAAGHRAHHDGSPGPKHDGSPGPRADRAVLAGQRAASGGSRATHADRPDWEADATAGAVRTSRPRLRVGWHKGSEVDEELWPAEAFGGMSDEEFWDDLASDKPLATTARAAAQPDSGSRRRLPDIVPVRDGREGDDRVRGDGNRIAGGGSGAYPPPTARPGPGDRTVIQPVQTGPQRVQTGTQPIQTGTQPTPVATRSYQLGTQPQPYQAATQSYQSATQPSPIAGQVGRAGLPTDPRGRGRGANGSDAGVGATAGDDPLTSAAYALRPPGAVDGRSHQSPRRSRELSREQYEAAVSQETQGFSLADAQAATAGYPGEAPPLRQFELPAGGGGGNGRASEPRPDGIRSDTTRYDGLRSDPLRSDSLRTDSLRTDSLRSDAYWSGGRPDPLRGPGTADAYGSTAGHPYPERPYSDPAQSANTQSASTPPYGDSYGYGYPVNPVDDSRKPNGARGQGRSGGTGSWGARQAYPAGHGSRGPYDPRANGRG